MLAHSHLARLFTIKGSSKESANDLRLILDTTRDVVTFLKHLGCPTQHWDILLIFLTLQKVDPTTRRKWEAQLSRHPDDSSDQADDNASVHTTDSSFSLNALTWDEFENFLESRIRTLSMLEPVTVPDMSIKTTSKPATTKNTSHTSDSASMFHVASTNVSPTKENSNLRCRICDQEHRTYDCRNFKQLSVDERRNEAARLRLCFNCLGRHKKADCPSKLRCHQCKQSHHTLLHGGTPVRNHHPPQQSRSSPHEMSPHASSFVPDDDGNSHQEKSPSDLEVHTTQRREPTKSVIVTATALVNIISPTGAVVSARALLDTGSEATIISENVTQKLNLPRTKTHTILRGIGGGETSSARFKSHFILQSRIDPDFKLSLEGFVLPQVTNCLPSQPLINSEAVQRSGLQLADPTYSRPEKADLILPADVFFSLIKPGMQSLPPTELFAINSSLGWILGGKGSTEASASISPDQQP